MPGSGTTDSFIGGYRFRITIDGADYVASEGVMKVSTPSATTETFDWMHGIDPAIRKAPGRIQWDDITIERVFAGRDDLFSWWSMVEEGTVERRSVKIEYLKADGVTVVWTYTLLGAFPNKWELPDMDAGSTGAAMEKITITYEKAIRE